MKQLLLVWAILIGSVLFSENAPFPFFEPPHNWQMSNPIHFTDGVKIGFVQSERKIFTPAITLSLEKIPCDEKTYIETVKKNHRSDITKRVRELGLLETKSGKAHLIQIDMKNNWGKIRILQSILVKDQVAYIQTASCLREDFLKIHQDFLSAFRSLTVADGLLSSLSNHQELEDKLEKLTVSWKKYISSAKGKKEELFKESFFQKNQWGPFTDYVTKKYAENGICWQILAIQYIKDQLMSM